MTAPQTIELTSDEMLSINGGEPITLTAVALWVGAGLVVAGVGAVVGYVIAS